MDVEASLADELTDEQAMPDHELQAALLRLAQEAESTDSSLGSDDAEAAMEVFEAPILDARFRANPGASVGGLDVFSRVFPSMRGAGAATAATRRRQASHRGPAPCQ